MERYIFAMLCTLVHIPSIFIRYAPFRGLISTQRRNLLFALYTFILVLVFIGYYTFGKQYTMLAHKLMLLGIAFILSALNVLFIPGHWREHCFTAGLASIHVCSTFFLCTYFIMRIWHISSSMEMVAAGSLATFVLFLILWKYFVNSAKRVVTPFLSIECTDYWKRVWFLPMPLFFASFFSAPIYTYYDDFYSFISRFFLLVATVLLSNSIAEDHNHMSHRIKLAEQLNIQKEYHEYMTERVHEARKSRHDFKHHLTAIFTFIDKDDKEGLTEYCKDLNYIVSNSTEVPYTGNLALDGVLYRYATLADQYQIRFDLSGSLDKIVMSDTDFSVLMGNALDNAFNGCLTLESGRFIYIHLHTRPSEQTILISNSFDGVVQVDEDRLLSRKRDNEAGLGLDSMRAICDKYNAIMDIRYDENTFSLLLLIGTQE